MQKSFECHHLKNFKKQKNKNKNNQKNQRNPMSTHIS